MNKQEYYRKLPKIDDLLKEPLCQKIEKEFGRELVCWELNCQVEGIRSYINQSENPPVIEEWIEAIVPNTVKNLEALYEPALRPVINGTGTILHTNLGRAPIGKRSLNYLIQSLEGYSNLEYDLKTGSRGRRMEHTEEVICKVTGAQAATAVNNNAAAVLLILNTLAKGREAVVSRGELVEIGGQFRIPDVMEQSGASLVETGTTNRTRIEDYEQVLTEQTAVLLKVHTSNYRIVGFTESVKTEELCQLGTKHKIPVVEDLGSGVLVDLRQYGLSHEPTVQEVLKAGVDLVCFSGDKLLGGPQAGIIAGKKKYVDAIKKNPLMRALRLDKMSASVLETTFKEYLAPRHARENIPVLKMLGLTREDLLMRAERVVEGIKKEKIAASVRIEESMSCVGGGSCPQETQPSIAVAVFPKQISVEKAACQLRSLSTPVIVRTVKDRILIDMRTIKEDQISNLMDALVKGLKEE